MNGLRETDFVSPFQGSESKRRTSKEAGDGPVTQGDALGSYVSALQAEKQRVIE
jgi:hypothetical protein